MKKLIDPRRLPLLAPLLAVAVSGTAAADGKPCDLSGKWQLQLNWQQRDCDPEVSPIEQMSVIRTGDGRYAAQAPGETAVMRTFGDPSNACQLEVRKDVVGVIDGQRDVTRYTYSLFANGRMLAGTVTYQYLGYDVKNDRGCTQIASVTGARSGSGSLMMASAGGTKVGTGGPVAKMGKQKARLGRAKAHAKRGKKALAKRGGKKRR